MNLNAEFQWQCHPRAELFILNLLENSLRQNSLLSKLEIDLFEQTSTSIFDWLDHISLSYTPEREKEILDCGFTVKEKMASGRIFTHPGAHLPRIVVYDQSDHDVDVGILVESVSDFLLAKGWECSIEGSPFSAYRRCHISTENGVRFWVVERRGAAGMEPSKTDNGYLNRYFRAQERWESRPRVLEDEELAFNKTFQAAQEMVDLVGQNIAAEIALGVERKYWQLRNLAGQIQKGRQDRLGMGWANHDHHTFRSSRRYFQRLVQLFELLGFYCRERFYAGQEAGWGAQVMEHNASKCVLFLDVDLAPYELEIDFAHQQLEELSKLGTIGLWCALHGDSILRSGMHHLEAQFLFDDLKTDLESKGIKMMEPFSSFPYLRQAFTVGEVWKVDPKRIEKLQKEGKITEAQAAKFLSQGALGSHLENLQRREGYKGFNQKNVSFIIRKTDPRSLE